MDTYSKDNVGKLLAWKGDHFVYEYGADRIIKFSKLDYLLGFKKAKKIVPEEHALCKRFFGKYLLDTQIVMSADQKWIGLIQPKIAGRCLTRNDLRDQSIKKQFREIAQGYNAMITGGYPEIDLVGHEGLSIFKRCLGNILVTTSRELVIYDATLLQMDRFGPFIRPFIYCLIKIFLPFQRSTIKRFLAYTH